MSGTTTRRTWLSTLAVVLGLFALPTFAHAQTEEAQKHLELQLEGLRFEVQRAEGASQAQAELEKARAEMAKLQAQIKMTQDHIKALEARLAEMKAKGGEKPRVAVVETRPAEVIIVLRKVGDKWEVVPQPGKQPEVRMLWKIDPQFQPLPAAPPVNKPAPESRLENLERQLQAIMKELEALRKDMKQPRPAAPKSPEGQPRIQFELKDIEKSLPPGVKIEGNDGIRIITLPVEIAPAPKPGAPIEIERKK